MSRNDLWEKKSKDVGGLIEKRGHYFGRSQMLRTM